MLKALIARFKEGCRTGSFPSAPPNLPPDFRGRPVIEAGTTAEEVAKMQAACPVAEALSHDGKTASLDMGKCIFCARCSQACAKIRFTKEYRLGVFRREDLLELIWKDYSGDIRTVDVHIRRLRQKIEGDQNAPEYVYTKWGVGYYFAEK